MKICTNCKEEKELEEFPDRKYKNGKISKQGNCFECKRKKSREVARKIRANSTKRLLERKRDLERRKNNPRKEMWSRAKKRAKLKGIFFNLKIEDIHINKICPILNIPIEPQSGGATDNSPSLDRIDSTKGYTKDNICVISRLANIMKAHATKEQIFLFCDNIKKYVK